MNCEENRNSCLNIGLSKNETCFYEQAPLSTSEGVFLAQVSHLLVIFHFHLPLEHHSHFLQVQRLHLLEIDDTFHQIFPIHVPNKHKIHLITFLRVLSRIAIINFNKQWKRMKMMERYMVTEAADVVVAADTGRIIVVGVVKAVVMMEIWRRWGVERWIDIISS